MRFIVIGGGCYGTFYARQLLRAGDAGAAVVDEIVIVDRNAMPRARRELESDTRLQFVVQSWDDFLDSYLTNLDAQADDRIVPSPFTPHLALAWLLRHLGEAADARTWRIEPFEQLPGTPFQRQASGGPLLLSHADWICPVHCVEPRICPHTRALRDWDMSDTAFELAEQLARGGTPVDQLHLFCCHHLTHGVGAYPAADIPRALEEILRAPSDRKTRVVVGTVSRCHGALNLLVADPGMDSV